MAEIHISKIKARRGTDQQRRSVLYDQGELVYTTDTKRLYVGNGLLSGGNSIASKIHPPLTNTSSLSNLISEVGDITSINNVWYQLTAIPYTNANNWGQIRLKTSSELFFDSTSTLNLAFSGVSATKINPNTIEKPIDINNGFLTLNYNTSFFELSNNALSIKENSVTKRELLSSSFGNGLSGGSGNVITLKTNPSQFFFDGGVLNSDFSSISSYGDNNKFFLPQTNTDILTSLDAKLGDIVSIRSDFYQLTSIPSSILQSWGDITPTSGIQKSTFGSLIGDSTSNSSNSLSSIFNGTPAHSLSGGVPGITITKFEAISTNGVSNETITLSSAGFLTFEGGFETKTGQLVGRFAIPIFAY